MKPIPLIILTCLLAVGSVPLEAQEAQPETKALEAPIDSVLVYVDRAVVTRRVDVKVPRGRHVVEIQRLTDKLVDASVRVKLPTGSPASLAALELQRHFRHEFTKAEAEQSSKKVLDLQRELTSLADRHKQVLESRSFLANISGHVNRAASANVGKPDPVKVVLEVETWKAVLDFVVRQLNATVEKAARLEREMDQVNARLLVAREAFSRLASARVVATRTVRVEMVSAAETTVPLELTYTVQGASWFPRYDVRADTDAGKVELVASALVKQQTGEDWSGARIEFSTANPARTANLPELPIAYIRSPEVPSFAVNNQGRHFNQMESKGVPWEDLSAPRLQNKRPDGWTAVPGPAKSRSNSSLQLQLNDMINNSLITTEIENPDTVKVPRLSRKSFKGKLSARNWQDVQQLQELEKKQQTLLEQGNYDGYMHLNRRMLQTVNKNDTIQKMMPWVGKRSRENIARANRAIEARRFGRGLVSPATSAGGYDHRYRSLRRETIASDGIFTKVVLLRQSLPAEFVYEVAPELSTVAYLVADLTNSTEAPLLAGPAAVFLGSDFVGDSTLETVRPRESFKVGLGADENIRITRRRRAVRSKTGFWKNWYTFDTTVDLTVTNHRTDPVELRLFERMPFTHVEDGLEIKFTGATPKPAERTDRGLVRWRLSVAPAQTVPVQLNWTTSHKTDKQLVEQPADTPRW